MLPLDALSSGDKINISPLSLPSLAALLLALALISVELSLLQNTPYLITTFGFASYTFSHQIDHAYMVKKFEK